MKKLHKHILSLISSVLFFLTGVAPLAFAQTATPISINPCPSDANFQVLCLLKPQNAFSSLVTFVIVIAIVIALIFLMWGGIKWILSEGDKGKVDAARNHIVAALVGLVILFAAYFVINLLLNLFFGKNINEVLNIPQINFSQ